MRRVELFFFELIMLLLKAPKRVFGYSGGKSWGPSLKSTCTLIYLHARKRHQLKERKKNKSLISNVFMNPGTSSNKNINLFPLKVLHMIFFWRQFVHSRRLSPHLICKKKRRKKQSTSFRENSRRLLCVYGLYVYLYVFAYFVLKIEIPALTVWGWLEKRKCS